MSRHHEPDPPLTEPEIDHWLQSLGRTDEERLLVIKDLLAPHNGKGKIDPMLKSDRLICERTIAMLEDRLDLAWVKELAAEPGELISWNELKKELYHEQAAVQLSIDREDECDSPQVAGATGTIAGPGSLCSDGCIEVSAEDDYPYNSRDLD